MILTDQIHTSKTGSYIQKTKKNGAVKLVGPKDQGIIFLSSLHETLLITSSQHVACTRGLVAEECTDELEAVVQAVEQRVPLWRVLRKLLLLVHDGIVELVETEPAGLQKL